MAVSLMSSKSCFFFLEKAKNQVAFAVRETRMRIKAQATFLRDWELKLYVREQKIVWIWKILF